jgi:peptide chain release factor 1
MKMAKDLLFSITKKDFQISYFNGIGKGGQGRNKLQNCVRLKHIASGVMTTGQNQKSQKQNLKDAFNRMVKHPKFKLWLKKEISKATMDYAEIERNVEKAMMPENLKIEYLNEGI